MTGRRRMMVLATALLAGSLLATSAQAHGGGGGGGGHGGGGGFSAVPWVASAEVMVVLWRRSHGWLRRRSHGEYGPRSLWLWKTGFGGYYDYGSCPYYTSYNWPTAAPTEW